MEKRVYYGEYSLRHWLDLIIKENIELPWYQRSFVWDKAQIEGLIGTLNNNQFIPPIIIGAVRKEEQWRNFILDGQQRLTSILFTRLNKYIDPNEFITQVPNAEVDTTADELPDPDDDPVVDKIKIIKWNFSQIIKDKQVNKTELQKSFYKQLLTIPKEEEWFNKHFLGFAYIKPSNDVNEEDQSKFYSDIFRNINVGGTKLTRLESRKSLYFLKEDLKDFFAPEFLNVYKVETSSKESGLIDFIKYLSILSQYHGNNGTLYKYGGRDWERNENYYHKYIMAIVDKNTDNDFHFDISYPNLPFDKARIDKLEEVLSQLNIQKTFPSIIEMDMYFFGLINEVVFLDKTIKIEESVALKTRLNQRIDALKNTDNHRLNPNALKYLKPRITESINIYRNFEAQNE